MLKIVETDSEYFRYEPNVRLLHGTPSHTLVKTAADASIDAFAKGLQPEPDRVYVHILAMGASEAWGANRNADSFPEDQLIAYHETFVTSPAHIFRNHVNKDPSIAIGQVVFSTYNKRMRRVEVIAWIDREKGADVVARIEAGDFPPTSMACRTPYDVCSICGNKAATRQAYCEHLTEQLGRMYPDGRKVSAMNVAPLSFFDMSIVIKPADVTSAVLTKIASNGPLTQSSAEVAEALGLSDGPPPLNKLAELVKKIEDGYAVDSSASFRQILDKIEDPPHDVIPYLAKFPTSHVLSTMAAVGILPSVRFLSDMIGYSLAGEDAYGVGGLVEEYLGSNGASGLDTNVVFGEAGDPLVNHSAILQALHPFVKQASLAPEYVIDRAVRLAPSGNQGYVGNGPGIHPDALADKRALSFIQNEQGSGAPKSLMRTLLLIGSAAVAARWFIQHKMYENAAEGTGDTQGGAIKIVLVKSASDAFAMCKIAQASLVMSISKRHHH